MRGVVVLFTLLMLRAAAIAQTPQEYHFPSQTSDLPRYLGGLQISRTASGGTVVSWGGVISPRKVKVTSPDGAVTRFELPAQFHSPTTPPFDLINPLGKPAILRVNMPREVGVVYVNGQLVASQGTVRDLQTPLISTIEPSAVNVRIAYRDGDQVVIEERDVTIRGGELAAVAFDGSKAVRVPISAGD